MRGHASPRPVHEILAGCWSLITFVHLHRHRISLIEFTTYAYYHMHSTRGGWNKQITPKTYHNNMSTCIESLGKDGLLAFAFRSRRSFTSAEPAVARLDLNFAGICHTLTKEPIYS